MRKQTENLASSLPQIRNRYQNYLLRHDAELEEIRVRSGELGDLIRRGFMIVPKPQRSETNFVKELDSWLETDAEPEGATVALYLVSTDVDLHKFYEWYKSTKQRARPELEYLYFKHGIKPAPVLSLLAVFWITFECCGDTLSTFRSLERRRKDAGVLNAAADVLDDWRGVLEAYQDETFATAPKLRTIATDIVGLSPARRHRPKQYELIIFAQELGSRFKKITGHPLYEHTGNLILAAFPERWEPHNIKEATKKLFKAGKTEDELKRFTRKNFVYVEALAERAKLILGWNPMELPPERAILRKRNRNKTPG